VTSPPLISIRSALKTAGYDSSISHTDPTAIKTTAPNSVVWDVFRGWNKLNPAKNLVEGSAASTILAKEPSIQANFDVHAAYVKSKKKVPRFTENPAYWGPLKRAKGAPLKQKQQSKKTKTKDESNN